MAVAKFVARQTDWYELREAFPFLLIRNGKWPRPECGRGNTEIGKKAWLFAKLQPGRARKRTNAT